MFLDYYQSYLSMIQNSVWSSLWKHLYITKENGNTQDILQDGNVSCAYFVSCILKTFGLCGASFANVKSLQKHLLEYWWQSIPKGTVPDQITRWSIIIREAKEWSNKEDIYWNHKNSHYHIGFYMGNEQAISNMSDAFVSEWVEPRTPQIHHFTYQDTRPIHSILSFNFAMNLEEHFSQKRYTLHINKQLEIPFIGQSKKLLEQYWFEDDDLAWALWTESGLKLGRMCWPACLVMAYQAVNQKKDIGLLDALAFKDQRHELGDYYKHGVWRYHDGLIAIAKKRWLSAFRDEMIYDDINWFKKILADCIENKRYLICSVSTYFTADQRWWHLVVVRWYNRNGFQEELIINDPLNEEGIPQSIPLFDFMLSRSGRYIVVNWYHN